MHIAKSPSSEVPQYRSRRYRDIILWKNWKVLEYFRVHYIATILNVTRRCYRKFVLDTFQNLNLNGTSVFLECFHIYLFINSIVKYSSIYLPLPAYTYVWVCIFMEGTSHIYKCGMLISIHDDFNSEKYSLSLPSLMRRRCRLVNDILTTCLRVRGIFFSSLG